MTAGASGRGGARSVLLLAALAAFAYLIEVRMPLFHGQAFMQPDSTSYLEANVARAPLYPLFVRAVRRLPGGVSSIGPVQHVLFLAGAFVLASCFGVVFARPQAALLLASIALTPPVVGYCFAVLPESLFMTALMLHLACAVWLARRWSAGAAAGAGVTAAALALIRPTGYAIVAGLLVLAFVHRGSWRRSAWIIAPAAVVLIAAAAANAVIRGVFATQAQGGYSRAAYVGHLLDPQHESRYPELVQRLAARTASIRLALEAVPSLDLLYLIGANQYHVVETAVHDEILAEISRERGVRIVDPKIFPSDPGVGRRLEDIAGTIANEAVAAHPGDYARQVAANVYGLWWLPLVRSRAGASATEQQIGELRNRYAPLDRSSIAFRPMPLPLYLPVRASLIAIVACGVLSLGIVWSRSTPWATVGYAGVLVHGSFLLVSLAQPGLPRYALSVWPASMLMVFGAAAALLRSR